MAQQYLLDCIIQVFPDEFHLKTLEIFLEACTKVVTSVDLKHVMVNLMTRLASYVQANTDIVPPDIDIFNLFRTHLQTIFERVPEESGEEPALELLSAFLNFTLTLYPDRVHYVDILLGSTVDILYRYCNTDQKLRGPVVDMLVELLNAPLRSLTLEVLALEHYPNCMRLLDYTARKKLANSLVDTVLEFNLTLSSVDDVNRFFTFITPLIRDDDTPVDENSSDFSTEQDKICRLVHQMRADDVETSLALLTAARSFFGQGGPQRMKSTLVPVVVQALRLLSRMDAEVPPKKVLQFVYKTCAALVSCAPEVAFNLWLQCARVAEACATYVGDNAFVLEFLTQAIICFEEEISDSREQQRAISLMTGTLRTLQWTFAESMDQYDAFASKLTQHGAKLLKKPQQCAAILQCCHLFWCDVKRDASHVLQCLQKCLKIADSAIQQSSQHVGLFVEILDAYIHFYEAGNPEISVQHISSLIALCLEHCIYAADALNARAHYRETLLFLRGRKRDDEWASKYAELNDECLTPSF